MAIQTATSGNLATAQRTVIAEARYTMEHSAPCVNLVEHMRLGKGESTITVPKAGTATADALVDGQDITSSANIGLDFTSLTTAEVGLKFILTDKLLRQLNEDAFRIVGRMGGDAMGRKKDTDVIALFSTLNSATALGGDNKLLTLPNMQACITHAKAHKMGWPLMIVHNPNAIAEVSKSSAVVPSQTYPMPHGFSEELLRDFYGYRVNQVPVFEDGNIAVISGTDSAYGAIFSKGAMVVVDSAGFNEERERDASLRAWELIITADYGCFVLDTTYGAPMRYEIGDMATDG